MAHVTQRHNQSQGLPIVNLDLWPRQEHVRSCRANEVFFGGSAGPGKSHLLRVLAIQYCTQIPNLQVYLFRRLFVDLAPNHMDGATGFRAMLSPWVDKKLIDITEEEIRWWNGSKIHLCHFQDWKDKEKYRGPEINVLLIDELTHFEERMYRWLRGRNRLGALREQMQKQIAEGELPDWYLGDKKKGKIGKFPLIVSASNPTGIGHAWVKDTFVDYARPDELVITPREEGGRCRVYFPATLDDNPSIDEEYEDNLFGLGDPEVVRAMRYGDWDVLAGGFFHCFRRHVHAIQPFGLPRHWPRVVSMDWGWAFPFSIIWLAVVTEDYQDPITKQFIPSGSVVAYREWYGSAGKDVGLKMPPDEVAQGIKDRMKEDPEPYGWVADQRLWKTDTGMSAGNIFSESGIHWERGAGNPGDRKEGWREVDTRLMAEPPLLYIFESCLDLIRTFGSVVRSESDVEDIDKNCESHALDSLRYGLMYISKGLSSYKKTPKIDFNAPLCFNDFWESHVKARKSKSQREPLL